MYIREISNDNVREPRGGILRLLLNASKMLNSSFILIGSVVQPDAESIILGVSSSILRRSREE